MAQTFKQAIKAVAKYAKSHGENYTQVEHIFISDYNNAAEGKYHFRAYINGFGIFAISETIEGLIEQFEAARAKLTPKQETESVEDILPF